MKVTSISYQKTFNLGNYQSERLGVEVEVGEHEYAEELMKEAKELVEKMHRDNNPGLYYQVNMQALKELECRGVQEKIIATPNGGVPVTESERKIQQAVQNNVQPLPHQVMKPLTKEEKKKVTIQNYIEVIKIAKSEKALSLYKAMVDRENNPELTAAYNEKLISLQNQPA